VNRPLPFPAELRARPGRRLLGVPGPEVGGLCRPDRILDAGLQPGCLLVQPGVLRADDRQFSGVGALGGAGGVEGELEFLGPGFLVAQVRLGVKEFLFCASQFLPEGF